MPENRKNPTGALILGVDPGTSKTGFGLISVDRARMTPLDFGCISPPSAFLPSKKYQIIFEGVTVLLNRYQPHALAVETQFIHKNPQSGIKLGMARGAVMLAATLYGIPVFGYPPAQAKKAIVGHGRASKIQIQAMIRRLLGLSENPKPEDAADALALAICHAHAWQSGLDEKHRI